MAQIYVNDNLDKLPNAWQLRQLLKKFQKDFPVLHMMPLDRVVDDVDKYILTRLVNGRFSIKPNITHQGLLYYGNCDYDKVKNGVIPPYYKGGYAEHDDFMENNIIITQFQQLVETFPLYDLFNKGITVGHRRIAVGNAVSLAAAYSLKTPFINLTSSIDVALFFATHEFEESTQTYRPKSNGVGVIYIYPLDRPFGMIPGLSTLGLQVFPRTYHVKQFELRLDKNRKFEDSPSVIGFTFKHDSEVSNKFADKFEKGRLLLPSDDFLIRKWNGIKKIIYSQAIEENQRQNPNDDKVKNKNALIERGYNIEDGTPSFSANDLSDVDLYGIWEQICDNLIIPFNRGTAILDFLRQIPSMNDYKKYFDAKKYYETK